MLASFLSWHVVGQVTARQPPGSRASAPETTRRLQPGRARSHSGKPGRRAAAYDLEPEIAWQEIARRIAPTIGATQNSHNTGARSDDSDDFRRNIVGDD
jgi:hypothetical protein